MSLPEISQQYKLLSLEIKEANDKLKPQKDKLKVLKEKMQELMIEKGIKELDFAEGKIILKSSEKLETINKKLISSTLNDENYSQTDIENITSKILEKRNKKTINNVSFVSNA